MSLADPSPASGPQRTEHDLLGSLALPADCLWGIHTERALRTLGPAQIPTSRRLIRAYALVKKACCQANHEIGALEAARADAIGAASDAIAAGEHADAFPLDALQGGAGTSTNMNLNEVIANLALQRLGFAPGDYGRIHPLDHVNRHQSTNDTYPTALKVAAIGALREAASAVQRLQGALQRREQAFAGVTTVGRTECMPAVPMTLGQIFGAMAEAVARDRWRLFKSEERLRTVNLGGTAVGNGLAAPRDYIFRAVETLRVLTGYGLSRAENLAGDTAYVDSLVEVSGMLKALAVNLAKTARDLRHLHAAGEIRLPPVQAGSSIMPGKINPVICEHVIQVAIWMIAQDSLIAQCAAGGTLQICEYLPLLAHALLEMLDRIVTAVPLLATHLDGIEADTARCAAAVAACPGLATALVPAIGYDRATELVRQGTEAGIRDWRAFLARELGEPTVTDALRPERLLRLGYQRPKPDPTRPPPIS
jgi:aspartate ammonia-lyase